MTLENPQHGKMAGMVTTMSSLTWEVFSWQQDLVTNKSYSICTMSVHVGGESCLFVFWSRQWLSTLNILLLCQFCLSLVLKLNIVNYNIRLLFWDKDHIILSSFHPDFKRNVRAAPIRAVDVYNVMCWTLGVEPLPNNGSWSRVEYLLNGSDGPFQPTTLWTCCLILLGVLLKLWD